MACVFRLKTDCSIKSPSNFRRVRQSLFLKRGPQRALFVLQLKLGFESSFVRWGILVSESSRIGLVFKLIPMAFVGSSAAVLLSCQTQESSEVDQPVKRISTSALLNSNEPAKCKDMFDNYCRQLYSPDARGNLELLRSRASIKVLQGETGNQFSQVFYRYAKAKIRNQRNLPQDFYRTLWRHDYFGKLAELIRRQPRAEMTFGQRIESERLNYELGYIWTASIEEAILGRMNRKFPASHQIPDKLMPIELDLERRRMKRQLISEISKAIWRDDTNWGKVEKGFARLQDAFSRMIKNLDIDEHVRSDWLNRIREIKLVLPGAMVAISDDECSTVTVNAYYYTYLNVLTVCAGDFNSEDIVQTLAHEMGHALGIDRSQYLFATRSDFGQRLTGLRNQVCRPDQFRCDDWETFKSSFPQLLSSLDSYKPELPQFQSCLKRRVTSRSLDSDAVERFARMQVADRISELASSDRFLRITKARIPTIDGRQQKNPNFLNPCSYYLWSQSEEPVDDAINTLIFFTAEYRCSQEKSDSAKLKAAIELARQMSERVLQKTIRIEGEFSSRDSLEMEGYASPPFERFADVIGSYAMAEFLKEYSEKWDRQSRFLASNSWQCIEPSLSTHFPEESSIEREYVMDAHSESEQRKKEIFSTPIREVLGCEKDFEFQECRLPLKSRR